MAGGRTGSLCGMPPLRSGKVKDRREYDDDDGRTVVDMRGVEKMPLFGSIVPLLRRELERPEEKPFRPWETEFRLTGRERFWYIMGTLKAALLIASAYIIGLGMIILLMLLVFNLK